MRIFWSGEGIESWRIDIWQQEVALCINWFFFSDNLMEIGRLNVQDHVLHNVCVCFGLLLSFLACLSLHLQQSNHSIRDLGGSHGSSDWRHFVQNVRDSFAHCLHLHLCLVCGSGTLVVFYSSTLPRVFANRWGYLMISGQYCIYLFLNLFSVSMRRGKAGMQSTPRILLAVMRNTYIAVVQGTCNGVWRYWFMERGRET